MDSKIVKYYADDSKTIEQYPVTLTKAIYDENGDRLDNTLNGFVKYDKTETETVEPVADIDADILGGKYTASDIDEIKNSAKSACDGVDAMADFAKSVKQLNDVDVNTITESGVYFCNSGNNIPVAKSGFLQVMYLRNDVRKLIYTQYDSNDIYTKALHGNVWSDWEKLVTESEVSVAIRSADRATIVSGGLYSYGKLCVLDITVVATSNNNSPILTIPTGYRPIVTLGNYEVNGVYSYEDSGKKYIAYNGEVGCGGTMISGNQYTIRATWIAR